MKYPSRERLRELLTSAIVVPGAPGVGAPGVAVPGAPSIGGPGLHPTAASGPYVPAPAGGATYGSLRFGAENSTYAFSSQTNGGYYLANQSQALGPAGGPYYRSAYVALPNMPTSGDVYEGIFFRTPSFGTAQTAFLNTILGVHGHGGGGDGAGGAVAWADSGLYTGSASGSEKSASAGLIQVQRNINVSTGFHLMGSGNSLVTTGSVGTWSPSVPQILADKDYLLIVGINGASGGLILVDIAANTAYQWTPAAAIVGRTLSSGPLFDQIGALGNASTTVAAAGFGGYVSDLFYGTGTTGTFPTAAQALNIATGATAISSLPGLVYWNTLDWSTQSAGVIPATVDTAAIGGATLVGSNLLGGAPIRKPSSLSINRLGAHWVFPLAIGKTSGNAWIEGTAPAGAVVNCQLQYVDATGRVTSTSATVQATADGSGKFAAAINSPGKKPFYRKVWPVNGDASNAVTDFDIMDVGIVVHVFGQSECERMNNMAATFTVSAGQPPTEATSANTGYSQAMPGSYTGPWASYLDLVAHISTGYNQFKCDALWPRPEIMLGSGYPGDAYAAAGAGVISRTGYSVMFVPLTRSGHPPDAFLLDGQTFTQSSVTPTGGSGTSGSPYTFTIKLTTADVTQKFGLTNYILVPTFQQQVKPGSVTLKWPDGTTVTDSFSGYTDASTYPTTTLSGGNGATGTVSNTSGGTNGTAGWAISVYFTGAVPAGNPSITWTVKQETQDGSYSNGAKTANINGFGCREAVDRVGNVGLRYGATMTWCYWITAFMTDSTSVGNALSGMVGDCIAKYSLLRQMAYGGSAFWPGYLGSGLALDAGVSSPPMIICPKGRETTTGYVHAYTSLDTVRQAQSYLWPGGAYAQTWALAGSWFYDIQVDGPSSPHENYAVAGGPRQGRRMAYDIANAFAGNTGNDAITWDAPQFSNFNSGLGGYTTITVPVSAAWQAAHPGVTLALSSIDGSSSSALGEWYVGGTATTNGNLVDNGTYATASLRNDNLAVIITAASGVSWQNTALVRYLMGGPGIVTASIASGTYDNTSGNVVLTLNAPAPFGNPTSIALSGLTGTGAYASLDNTYTTTSVSGTTVNFTAASGLGATTITGGTLTLSPSNPPPAGLLYDSRGGFGSNTEPGLPVSPKFS